MTTTKIINLMFYLVIFTISFDVFLVINIGFNFRAAQLCLIIPMIFYILNIFLKGTITVPLGITSLLIWTLFVIIFIPNTPLMSRNIGYGIWLNF
ncbi:cellulose synthase/poly-beta-1,6-N-acetylglucosamine synthase-like glycosyltransferase [Paenibacillus sp. V4I7]|nr:cellulose synthase/poly-beta-1,6-N-acetylglucosamine synthase-like glycosyltransferase [Paenibacillus sp. V4I7]